MGRLFNRRGKGDQVGIGELVEGAWQEIAVSNDPLGVARSFHRQMLQSRQMRLYAAGAVFLVVRLNRIALYGANFEQSETDRREYLESRKVAAVIAASMMPRVHAIDPAIDSGVVANFLGAALAQLGSITVEDLQQLGDDLVAILILAMGFGVQPTDPVWLEVDDYMKTTPVAEAIRSRG